MHRPPSYLLAIKSPPAAARHIDGIREALAIDRSYAAGKLHATLAPLGPDDLVIGRLTAALRNFKASPFRIAFDRIDHATLKEARRSTV